MKWGKEVGDKLADMGLHSVMDHLKWQTQRQTKEEREGEGGGKPIQIETPQSVSYNKSSKRNAERESRKNESSGKFSCGEMYRLAIPRSCQR